MDTHDKSEEYQRKSLGMILVKYLQTQQLKYKLKITQFMFMLTKKIGF